MGQGVRWHCGRHDDHQSHREQRHHHPQQGLVKAEFAHRHVARAGVGAVGQAHRQVVARGTSGKRAREVALSGYEVGRADLLAMLATEAACYDATKGKSLGMIDSIASATAGFNAFVDHLNGR